MYLYSSLWIHFLLLSKSWWVVLLKYDGFSSSNLLQTTKKQWHTTTITFVRFNYLTSIIIQIHESWMKTLIWESFIQITILWKTYINITNIPYLQLVVSISSPKWLSSNSKVSTNKMKNCLSNMDALTQCSRMILAAFQYEFSPPLHEKSPLLI